MLERFLIFFSLGLAGFTAGWEVMLAGIILFLGLKPEKYEFIILGIFADLVWPADGFFTLSVLLLLAASSFLSGYFETKNISSVAVRIVLLLLLTFLGGGIYLSLKLEGEIISALGFSGQSLLKTALFTLLFLSFYKFLNLGYEKA